MSTFCCCYFKPGITILRSFWRREVDGVGSGPTASRCAAEPWASKPATSGITQVCGVVGGPEAGMHAPAL